MEIYGKIHNERAFISNYGSWFEGALSYNRFYGGDNGAYGYSWTSSAGRYGCEIIFTASSSWSGETSQPSTSVSGFSGGNETRPSNYTKRIWKRIA